MSAERCLINKVDERLTSEFITDINFPSLSAGAAASACTGMRTRNKMDIALSNHWTF